MIGWPSWRVQPYPKKQAPCRWRFIADPELDYYETECGEEFGFVDGTPEENTHRYCPACGRRLVDMSKATDKVKDTALRFG